MTVSNPNSVVEYTGNGTIAPIPVPYRFFKSSDLLVIKLSADGLVTTTLTLNIDYSVSGAGSLNGGTVTPASAVLVGEKITISRILPVQQLTDLRNQGNYFAEIHEDVFDYLTMLIQQGFAIFARALLRPIGLNDFFAENRRITNLKDPISDQDAVTRIWIQQNIPNGFPIGDYLRESNLFPPATGGTDTRGVEFTINKAKGALRVGGSDPAPTNDEMGFWATLPSPNAWGYAGNIGLYSTAFNRNGVSFGAYSNTFGHDCIALGVASVAGGAGSCTGAPSNISSSNFEGYCSIAWGKNVQADGQKSAAFGETTRAAARASLATGYQSLSAPGPNTGPAGVASEGIGAHAMGYGCQAYGDGSIAMGNWARAYDGTITIGSGINPGSPLVSQRARAVCIGANSNRPSITVAPGPGVTNAHGPIGLHTETPRQAVELVQLSGETLAIRTLVPGTKGNVTFQGSSNADASLDLFRIEVESTNGTSSLGILRVFVNGSATASVTIGTDGVINLPTTGLKVNGTKVLGAQSAAIPNSDGSLLQTADGLNKLLIAARAHGLIAP